MQILRRFKRKSDIIPIFFIMIVVGAFYFPIIKNLQNTVISENDWYRSYYYAGIARNTILKYHQLPLRTPYLGGGYPSIASTIDFTFSPFFAFVLLFGEVSGLRLMVFSLFILGAIGMFYLTRKVLNYNTLGASFSSLVFSLCNWGVYEIVDGNIEKAFYYLLPWVFAFFLKAVKQRVFIVFTSFVLVSLLTSNAAIFIPIILSLFILACLYSVSVDKGFKIKPRMSYLGVFFVILFMTFIFSAAKTIPMLQLYGARTGYIHLPYEDNYSKIAEATRSFGSALNLETLRAALFNKDFRNYSVMYFGYIPIIVFVVSVLIYPLVNYRYLLLFFIFLLIQFGANSPLDIFKIIWNLHPIMHGIWRLDKYFGFFPTFFISIISGAAFLVLKNRKIFTPLAIVLFLIGAGNMYINNMSIFNSLVYENKPCFKKYDDFSQVAIKEVNEAREWGSFSDLRDIRGYQPFWLLLNQNLGVTNFNWLGNLKISQYAVPKYLLEANRRIGDQALIGDYERLPQDCVNPVDLVSVAKVNPAYKGEVFFTNKMNKSRLSLFSPNKIIVEVNVRKPDWLIINQNFHKSWKVNKGRVINYNGLLAVWLTDEGDYPVYFYYVPADFYTGLLISCLGIFGAFLWLLTEFSRAGRKAK